MHTNVTLRYCAGTKLLCSNYIELCYFSRSTIAVDYPSHECSLIEISLYNIVFHLIEPYQILIEVHIFNVPLEVSSILRYLHKIDTCCNRKPITITMIQFLNRCCNHYSFEMVVFIHSVNLSVYCSSHIETIFHFPLLIDISNFTQRFISFIY